ncbi:GTPase activating protein Gap1 [Schizosaccharomyces octosporus yFS286]|uniref:GTPase activating protein Gap1 n=1 Tax=Schizosaccharomyces octosporus (strain yFS286) TaxID=483514 RepID=S9PZ24_SCHOY|nr:GTPase activating protein Gap1 [Schizosaccharomyces octosporus yFS286]EPX74336.1 GTPase activating protein Gap1 [Schizosaccharomyces octosporus yFS286]
MNSELERSGTLKNRLSVLRHRQSTSTLYTIDLDSGTEFEDDFYRLDRELQELKQRISIQSKRNFVLEKDVRFLDSRIALLIQNRMAQEEQNEFAKRLSGSYNEVRGDFPDDQKIQLYGALFFLLQSEPSYVASLVRRVKLSNMDALLQIVMFNIYGNQYESREEHLLLSLFQMVLTSEFEATSDVTSLLRANTPVSRMMTTYTRRGPGQAYLRSILYQIINEVAADDSKSLQINPLQVYQQLVDNATLPIDDVTGLTTEEIASIPIIKETIAERSTELKQITQRFLESILRSLDAVPYGIRWICKLIRSLINRFFPKVPDSTICSLIGGFFFLRFINPAIISPQTSMLLETNPSDNVRKTLAAIAKIIQSVANGTSSSKSQSPMFEPFLRSYETKVLDFLHKLGDVDDFYDALELDQYVALSKKNLNLEITVNEIYLTHKIILENLPYIPDPNSHIHTLMDELGEAREPVPQFDNWLVSIQLYNRWESSIPDLSRKLKVTREDILFDDAKTLFLQLLRLFPNGHHVTKLPLQLRKIADAVSNFKNSSLIRKGLKAIQLLERLSDLNLVYKENNYEPLASEVEKEYLSFDKIIRRIQVERDALKDVHKAICDHNEYLRTQLEIYASYLANARNQISGTNGESKRLARGVGVIGIKPKHNKTGEVVRFSALQMKKESILLDFSFTNADPANVYFTFARLQDGNFQISIYEGNHPRPIKELQVALEQVSQKRYTHDSVLDTKDVKFEANKLYHLFEQVFLRR